MGRVSDGGPLATAGANMWPFSSHAMQLGCARRSWTEEEVVVGSASMLFCGVRPDSTHKHVGCPGALRYWASVIALQRLGERNSESDGYRGECGPSSCRNPQVVILGGSH